MDYIGYLYSVLLMAGGVMGYITKGSVMSGLMGLGAGLVAVYAAHRSSSNPTRWGLSLIVAISLTALMGFRFFNTGKFMPAGLVAVLSVLMVARYSWRAVNSSSNKED